MSDTHDAGRGGQQDQEQHGQGGARDSGAQDHVAHESEGADDGFTPEEREQFESMRSDTTTAERTVDDRPDAQAGADQKAAQGGKGDGEDDDDDDGQGDQPGQRQPAPGKPQSGEQQSGQQAEGDKTPRRVSWSRYQRETKELNDKIAELQKQVGGTAEDKARLDERLRILNEALLSGQQDGEKGGQREDDDPEPDPEKDIWAHNAWLKRQVVKTQQRLDEFAGGIQEERQQTTTERQINQTYVQDVQSFAQREPNFGPAYKHLMESRMIELAQYKYGKDLTEEGVRLEPEEAQWIQNAIVREERDLVTGALRARQSNPQAPGPAERIFRLARARGFRPAAAQQQQNGQNGQQKPAGNGKAGNGAAPQKGAPGNLAEDPAAGGQNGGKKPVNVQEEIERIKNGQDAAFSLSGGGGSPTVPLTAERLASMPQEDFNALVENLSETQMRQIFGG